MQLSLRGEHYWAAVVDEAVLSHQSPVERAGALPDTENSVGGF